MITSLTLRFVLRLDLRIEYKSLCPQNIKYPLINLLSMFTNPTVNLTTDSDLNDIFAF